MDRPLYLHSYIFICSFKLKTLSKTDVSSPTPQDLCLSSYHPCWYFLSLRVRNLGPVLPHACLINSPVSTFVAFVPSITRPWLGLWYLGQPFSLLPVSPSSQPRVGACCLLGGPRPVPATPLQDTISPTWSHGLSSRVKAPYSD